MPSPSGSVSTAEQWGEHPGSRRKHDLLSTSVTNAMKGIAPSIVCLNSLLPRITRGEAHAEFLCLSSSTARLAHLYSRHLRGARVRTS